MKVFFLFCSLCLSTTAIAKTMHPEKYYQKIKCNELGGVMEYILPDKTRIDCLTDEYAIEFDFAKKWAESIGQSLYYATQTNRKAGIVLIMENLQSDMRYANRLARVAGAYDIAVWLMY